jgi:hypothetical protein
MPLTITKMHDPALPSQQAAVYDVQLDNNYPSGGYAITPGMFGRRDIHLLTAKQKGVATRICEYDYGVPGAAGEAGNGHLLVFTALGTQAVGGTDQSAVFVRVFVIGPAA